MKPKEQKRLEAEARQEVFNGLSTKQKLAKLNRSGYTAQKEKTKYITILKGERSINHDHQV